MSKTLIAYFSTGRHTARLAATIAEVTGGELFEIKPETPYTEEDLNWMDPRSRANREMLNPLERPAIVESYADMESVERVFLGFPIWTFEAPGIIYTFLKSYDFAGKTIIPFATSGSSDLGKTEKLLRRSCPAAKWLPGKRMESNESPEAVKRWVDGLE